MLSAIDQLPCVQETDNSFRYQRLPLFASKIAKDPHGFDLNTEQGRFLISALQFLRSHQEKNYKPSSVPSAEEITDLLAYFGIIRDDLLNFTTCISILGCEEGKTEPAPVWESACRDGVVLNVPLREVVKMAAYKPAGSSKKVFVLENSGVFSAILDCFTGLTAPPLICTHGQLKLAALIMLDKLVENGATIYYSGDFDPEGLQMAQRLVDRYADKLVLWHYTADDYKRCLSDVVISETRLKKLDAITAEELKPIKEEIKRQKKAGYQEYLIEKLVKECQVPNLLYAGVGYKITMGMGQVRSVRHLTY
ncbi:uncharacterized protein (TIGR02679 family) [Desulfohalotomaculum tongense]|nr:uncharacterized protein (TIGR02679 family) [Desulforadius tongensis]